MVLGRRHTTLARGNNPAGPDPNKGEHMPTLDVASVRTSAADATWRPSVTLPDVLRFGGMASAPAPSTQSPNGAHSGADQAFTAFCVLAAFQIA